LQVSQDYRRLSGCFVNLGCQNDHQQHPIDKSWVPHTQAKRTYFHAEACRLHARALLEKGPGCAGEAVAWLRYSLSAVLDGAAGKAAIKMSAVPVRDAAASLRREVESELAAAEKDNCQVYCERVPAADALTPLPGLSAPLVRASSEEKVLREPDGDAAVARGGAPTARH
jgi:programmed cell death 6-interacting protein